MRYWCNLNLACLVFNGKFLVHSRYSKPLFLMLLLLESTYVFPYSAVFNLFVAFQHVCYGANPYPHMGGI